MSNYNQNDGENLVRKNIFIAREQNELLRELAFYQRTTESEIIRQALKEYLTKENAIKVITEKIIKEI